MHWIPWIGQRRTYHGCHDRLTHATGWIYTLSRARAGQAINQVIGGGSGQANLTF